MMSTPSRAALIHLSAVTVGSPFLPAPAVPPRGGRMLTGSSQAGRALGAELTSPGTETLLEEPVGKEEAATALGVELEAGEAALGVESGARGALLEEEAPGAEGTLQAEPQPRGGPAGLGAEPRARRSLGLTGWRMMMSP